MNSGSPVDRWHSLYASGTLALLSLGVHILPFLLHGPYPLGYDTGFYRRYLTQPFVSFPNPPVPGMGADALLPRAAFDALRLLHLPPDVLLYGTYLVRCALLPVLLYRYLAPSLGARGAFIGGLLLVFSSVTYTTYWYFLFKNAWGLCLILLALAAFERASTWQLLLLDIAIALTHRTSAIIYLATLAILFIIGRGRRKELALHLGVTALAFALVNVHFVVGIAENMPQAFFLEWREYLLLSVPLLLMLPASVMALRFSALPRSLLAFAGASFMFPIFFLPFYERVFVFCDVALCAIAAYGAAYLVGRFLRDDGYVAWLSFGTLCVVAGLLLGNLSTQVRTRTPLMAPSDVASIPTITAHLPADATLLTTSDEAPWFEGWSTAHIAAPGMLRDHHSLDAWITFWNAASTAEKISFLNDFPKPLYISTFENVADLLGTYPDCIASVGPHLWYDGCSPNR